MQTKRFQIQRKLGFIWIEVDDFITEERARIEARKISGTTRVVPVWIEK